MSDDTYRSRLVAEEMRRSFSRLRRRLSLLNASGGRPETRASSSRSSVLTRAYLGAGAVRGVYMQLPPKDQTDKEQHMCVVTREDYVGHTRRSLESGEEVLGDGDGAGLKGADVPLLPYRLGYAMIRAWRCLSRRWDRGEVKGEIHARGREARGQWGSGRS